MAGEPAALAPDHDLDHLRGALEHIPDDRRRTAVDGGAHTGIWSEVLTQEFASVWAFEPAPDFVQQIDDRDNLHVETVALGSELAKGELVEGEENAGQAHVMPGEGVWIVPLDAYGLECVDFLKLDVEGFEQPALQGAYETLQRCRPWVMIERNHLAREYYGADPDGAHKRLRQWGWRHVGQWNKDHLYAP